MKVARWLALGIVLVALMGREVRAQTTSDAKLWTSFAGRVELVPRLRLDIEQQERLGADEGVESALTELGLRLRIHRMLAVGAQYRLAVVDPDGVAHRIAGDVRLQLSRGRWSAGYRLRLQRTSTPMESRSAVRNKLGASYALRKRVSPFLAAELHYLTTNSEFREFRVVAGVEVELTKRLDFGGFYMLQSEFNKAVDETNHIVGVGLSYTFRRIRSGKRKKGEDAEDAEEPSDRDVGEAAGGD